MFKLNCCIQATGMASSHKGNPMNRTKKNMYAREWGGSHEY